VLIFVFLNETFLFCQAITKTRPDLRRLVS